MIEYARSERVEELIRQILSEMIIKEMTDPRLEKVTITEVRVSADLKHAKIYISALGNKKRAHEALEALVKAQGYLRHVLGQDLRMKYMPELHFEVDETIETSMRIEKLLRKIKKANDEPEE